MKRLAAVLIAGAALLVARAELRHHEAEVFQDTLRSAAEEGSIAKVNDRFYRRGELEVAAATDLVGPDAARAKGVKPPFDDPIAAIADFDARLAEQGVELWVLPAPVRPWVAPHAVLPEQATAGWAAPAAYASAYRGFVDALEAEGITTIDLLPELQAQAKGQPGRWIHRTDPHWTGKGVVLASRRLASELSERGWVPEQREHDTTAKWIGITRTASAAGLHLPDEPDETVRVRRIRQPDDSALRVDDPDASVVIIGDSHVNWYYRNEADLGRQLVHETGMAVDTLPIVGGGATRSREELARRAIADPEYLASKRVVVWVFWMEDVWSREWGLVPLRRLPESKLQRRRGESRVSLDRHLMVRGRGEASLDFRWRAPGQGDDAADVSWIRKPEPAFLSFHGAVEEGASLILEVVGKGEAREAELVLPGERRSRFTAHAGSTRLRLPLPSLEEGTHSVRIGLRGEDVPTYVLGLRSLTLATTRRLWSDPLPPEDDGRFDAPLKAGGQAFPTTGARFDVEVPLEDVPGDLVVRARVRTLSGRRPLTLSVNGHVALDGKRIGRQWAEHAIRVPAAWWRAGANQLVWTTRGGDRVLAWDVLEIDAASP